MMVVECSVVVVVKEIMSMGVGCYKDYVGGQMCDNWVVPLSNSWIVSSSALGVPLSGVELDFMRSFARRI